MSSEKSTEKGKNYLIVFREYRKEYEELLNKESIVRDHLRRLDVINTKFKDLNLLLGIKKRNRRRKNKERSRI